MNSNSNSTDPLVSERVRMENLGRGFIIFLFAILLFAGYFLFGY